MAVKYKVKCPLCKSQIPFDAIKCPHCAGDLSNKEIQDKIKTQLKSQKIATGIILVVAIIFIFTMLGGDKKSSSQNSSDNTVTTSQGINVDFSKIEDSIKVMIDNHLVTKIDVEINQVYVNSSKWNLLNVEQKEIFAKALAYYVGHEKGTDLYWVEIHDWYSGKKLAKYSDSWGFTAY